MAAVEAILGDQGESFRMAGKFRERAEITHRLLNGIKGVRAQFPAGAFYVFPNITEACKKMGLSDSREFQDRLLYDAGVAVLARTCFGSRNKGETDEYVRLSIATHSAEIFKGLAVMKDYIENFKK
jgi:aspartate/methionine/tyrosine aminotransferase